ncbi:cysteine synthase a [Colletotrichum chrysophilum]|uniref:Cysteine synthase a n=1 Tax=Colletotrichum chrysophilum TaxID=1836956 RepID=A0AAD9EK33_9PEZI|nr:cysteine synthase a [Colletotrichum chrysophilum]
MAALGTKMDTVHKGRRNITLELWASMREVAAKELRRGEALAVDQFHHRDALVGYETMGKELLEQVAGGVDAFCTAVGTAGMAMGVAGVLKAANSVTKVAVLESWISPAIMHGRVGEHKVEGTGVGFVPLLLDREVRDVDKKYTRQMRRQIETKEPIYAGPSTALNVIAALELAKELRRGKNVLTVVCDSALKSMKGIRI